MLLGIFQHVNSLGGKMETIHQIQANTNSMEPLLCIENFARIFY